MLMRLADRLAPSLLYGLGIVFVAGLVHIVSVLAMPELAPKDAYARLVALAHQHQPVLLPQPLPGHAVTPFEDPAFAEAFCLFDLRQKSMHVTAKVTHDRLLTVSFRSRDGRVFYAMTDRAAVHDKIDVRIVTAAQLQALQAQDDEDSPPQELRLVAPQMKGFVLIKALAAFPSERAEAEARATSVSCVPEAIAQD